LSFAWSVSLNGAVPPPATYPLAAGRLGASALVFVALAAAAPFTVVTAVVPSTFTRQDAIVVPIAFVLLGVILLLFSVGYAAMARRAPTAGALYSFIARGLGRPIGVGAAWLALLSYNAIQIGLYGAAGTAAAPLLDLWFGVRADWWMVAAGCWAVVALCGLLRVDITGGLLAVVVIAEAAVITGFAAANLLEPGGGAITWRTVVPTDWAGIDRPALGLLLVTAAFAFVGFETAAAYGEESRRPRRSITRATALAVVLLTLLYAVPAWAMSIGAGSGRISALSAGRGSELMFDLAGARLAPWAVTLGRALVLTGLVAAMISLHGTIARYVFALGRERLLPAWSPRRRWAGCTPPGGTR
jgi:amino acid transporter